MTARKTRRCLLARRRACGRANRRGSFQSGFGANAGSARHECSELLLALSEVSSLCFPEVAEAEVAGLDSVGAQDAETESPDSEAKDFDGEPKDRQRTLGPEFLENLLRALPRFGDGSLCGAAAEKIASRPGVFSPVTLVVPAVERIGAGRGKVTLPVESSVQHLWTGAAEFLLLRSEVPPRAALGLEYGRRNLLLLHRLP